MIFLIWHIFLCVWGTGCVGVGFYVYSHSESKKLERQVQRQVHQTRLAELQARERKALDVGH